MHRVYTRTTSHSVVNTFKLSNNSLHQLRNNNKNCELSKPKTNFLCWNNIPESMEQKTVGESQCRTMPIETI